VPNFNYLKELIKKRISYNEVKFDLLHNSLFIKKIGLKVSSKRNLFLLKGIDLLYSLIDNCNATIWIDSNCKVNMKIKDIELFVNSWEELKIISEVFDEGIYNVQLSDEFIFIDIGMNVAITSLFTALNENVKKIYAYEPFKETFDLGIDNLNKNKKYSFKVEPHNYGLDIKTEELILNYLPDFKGSVGINGVPQRVLSKENENSIIKTKIIIKNVMEVINEIISNNLDSKFVIKIDCEGSEYNIIKMLNTNNILNAFSIIMLEWHEKGPEEIVNILKGNKFNYFSFDNHRKDVGMIYAVRNN